MMRPSAPARLPGSGWRGASPFGPGVSPLGPGATSARPTFFHRPGSPPAGGTFGTGGYTREPEGGRRRDRRSGSLGYGQYGYAYPFPYPLVSGFSLAFDGEFWDEGLGSLSTAPVPGDPGDGAYPTQLSEAYTGQPVPDTAPYSAQPPYAGEPQGYAAAPPAAQQPMALVPLVPLVPMAAAVAPPPQEDAVTLIFKDGRRPLQVRNYALTRTAFYITGQHIYEIPLSDLDLPATERVNREAGVLFQVP